MPRELFGEFIDVTDRQARTNLTQVDQRAPFGSPTRTTNKRALARRSN
jgi:hypothetical protein